jgi:hypothetical protein
MITVEQLAYELVVVTGDVHIVSANTMCTLTSRLPTTSP